MMAQTRASKHGASKPSKRASPSKRGASKQARRKRAIKREHKRASRMTASRRSPFCGARVAAVVGAPGREIKSCPFTHVTAPKFGGGADFAHR